MADSKAITSIQPPCGTTLVETLKASERWPPADLRLVIFCWSAVLSFTAMTWAAQSQVVPQFDKELVVGTKHAPPFAIQNPDGSWSGISIELWREIAKELDLSYRLEEFDLQGLLAGIKNGSLDVAVAALTVTAEREEAFDFSHTFHSSGLGIAVLAGQKGRWLGFIRRFMSWGFFKVVFALVALLFGVGLIVWLFERKRNPNQFGGRPLRGIGAGFWWSAVTMTTVGYGDKAPQTLGGRLVAMIWMFAAILIISGFTGAIAATITLGQLEGPVGGPEDLPKVRVGTISGSTSETYLHDRHIAAQSYSMATTALEDLSKRELDAVVYDAPILRYLAATQWKGEISVLPGTFQRQDYAFAVPANSQLREPINRVLVEKIRSPQWQDVLYRYLGQ